MSKDYGRNWDTPVLILNCKIGALAIMRTLGSLGAPIYGIDEKSSSPELKSRFLKRSFVKKLDPNNPREYLDFVLEVAEIIGQKSILIPTSDELSVFVAEYGEELKEFFMFPSNSGELLDQLADKRKMFALALENNVPTPHIVCPQNLEDVKAALTQVQFPIMLKAIDGNKLFARTGVKMVIVETEEELFKQYELLEDPEDPNLMLQELIPGDDDQVYIFNGYFNEQSDCLAAFTGHKVRQYPIHVGCASLGECRWHERVAEKTQALMKAVGYRGILDIGYRLDPRDGRYKVLDINPRVGQAFRIFVAENNMDVIRSLYLDLTGQSQPEIKPVEGRRWLIEDYDFVSSCDYFKEGSLKFVDWIKSFKSVKEGAWFSWKDPVPFLYMKVRFIFQIMTSIRKKMRAMLNSN
ncbi:hypothetical protein NBRC116493_11180 [Aurantivibrio infirmus]